MEIISKNNDWLKLGLIAMSKSMEFGFWLHGHIGVLVIINFFFVDEHHFKLAYSLCSLFSILKDIDEDLVLEKVSGHWELLD